MDTYGELVNKPRPDILGLCETHIDSNTEASLIAGYRFFRKIEHETNKEEVYT